MLIKSLVSRYILQLRRTGWFIVFWPLFVAPNTVRILNSFKPSLSEGVTKFSFRITLLGLAIVVSNFLALPVTILCNKDDHGGLPRWVYFTWATGLFLYQSLTLLMDKFFYPHWFASLAYGIESTAYRRGWTLWRNVGSWFIIAFLRGLVAYLN